VEARTASDSSCYLPALTSRFIFNSIASLFAGRRSLLLLPISIELLEKRDKITGLLLVLQTRIDHLRARYLCFWILDIFHTYSEAMKANKSAWTAAALDAYLADPRGDVHGAKMFFEGLPESRDRADVIAYLTTLK
jgi:hypothetical protein